MSALLLSTDLMTSSQAQGAAQRAGVSLLTVSGVEPLLAKAAEAPQRLVILDLSTPGLDPATLVPRLQALAQPPAAIVAFGPHVQAERLAAAAAAGCQVLSRGQFHAGAEQLLRSVAG